MLCWRISENSAPALCCGARPDHFLPACSRSAAAGYVHGSAEQKDLSKAKNSKNRSSP